MLQIEIFYNNQINQFLNNNNIDYIICIICKIYKIYYKINFKIFII
jgi:hypothetical protein